MIYCEHLQTTIPTVVCAITLVKQIENKFLLVANLCHSVLISSWRRDYFLHPIPDRND